MLETKKILEEIKKLITEKNSTESEIRDTSIQKKIQNLLEKIYNTYNKKMEEYISSKIELWEDESICAIISKESYRNPIKRSKSINNFILNEKDSTKDIAIYVDIQRKICVLWYRWTNIKKLKDLISDAQILLNIQGLDPRVKAALHMYDFCRRKYENFWFRVCGHSLWWTISYIIGKHREPDKCIVFNPGVWLNTFFFQMIEDTIKGVSWTKKTKTYKILWDIVSTVAFVGSTKIFTIKASDPLKKHALYNFLPPKKMEDILKNVTLKKLIEQ